MSNSKNENVLIYTSALLCVGHKGIHTHLFQRNLSIGYNSAVTIREKLFTLGLLRKQVFESGELIYLVNKKQLEKFIKDFLSDNKHRSCLDNMLVRAGEEAVEMYCQIGNSDIEIPSQEESTDAESVVYLNTLLTRLKKPIKIDSIENWK